VPSPTCQKHMRIWATRRDATRLLEMAKMRMLSFSELHPAKGIPFSRDYIRRLANAGRFPKPIKLGARPNARLAWPEPEIDRWLSDRLAERDTSEAA
jgi:prophage regulatory protein